MANIAKRPNGQWRARYRDHAGNEHSRHFPRKVDAQDWLDEVTASVVTGSYIDPKSAKVTVADYAATWQAGHVGREGTARIVDNALRLHILPRLGARRLQSVLRSDVQMLVKGMSESHAAGTVRNVYDVLAKVFGAAVDDRMIASSPCRRIVLPRVNDSEVTPPTVGEVEQVARAMPERYRAAVILLAGSGLRIGELLGLEVADVDFLRKTVRVRQQRMQNGLIAETKTPKSVRTIPVGQVVLDELAAHLAQFPATDGLFTAGQGQPLRYNRWKAIWNAALKTTGLDMDTHSLRHFYASDLISGGASVKQVQMVLGHASPVVTLRVYSHLWPGDDDRIRSISDATLEPLRTARGLEAV